MQSWSACRKMVKPYSEDTGAQPTRGLISRILNFNPKNVAPADLASASEIIGKYNEMDVEFAYAENGPIAAGTKNMVDTCQKI